MTYNFDVNLCNELAIKIQKLIFDSLEDHPDEVIGALVSSLGAAIALGCTKEDESNNVKRVTKTLRKTVTHYRERFEKAERSQQISTSVN
jgi:hypothetical protein